MIPGLAFCLAVLSGPQGSASPQVVEAPSPSFTLSVAGGAAGTVEGRGSQIPAKAAIERLSQELGIPIKATALVQGQTIDLEAGKRLPVSAFLERLAPVVLIDIEVGGGAVPETWKAIHLAGYNEPEPVKAVVQKGLLIAAGYVDEDGNVSVSEGLDDERARQAFDAQSDADPAKPMLAVLVRGDLVSVKARRQHIAGLLNEVALKAGVAFDIRGEPNAALVDINMRDLPIRDLAAALGRDDVRVSFRRNLATGQDFLQGVIAGREAPQEPKPTPTPTPRARKRS